MRGEAYLGIGRVAIGNLRTVRGAILKWLSSFCRRIDDLRRDSALCLHLLIEADIVRSSDSLGCLKHFSPSLAGNLYSKVQVKGL